MPGLTALALLLAQPEPVPDRLPPVERCSKEPAFSEFRSRLKDVVARKDEPGLLAMLAEDVEVNFGGDRGPALFTANWQFAEVGDSHVWAELEEALAQGCAPAGEALVSPSFVTQFPEQLDAFDTIILRPGALLRSAGSDTSAVTSALDWHLASLIDETDETWLKVQLVDGRRGFVRRAEAVHPLDYRLVFEKRGGKWMITAFVAGD